MSSSFAPADHGANIDNGTIKLNVGGETFEISRLLIARHEETMLARLVSPPWHTDPSKPVFIDRNGRLFHLILDYLRYGSIILPMTTPMDTFLRELDFYGIVPKNGTITRDLDGLAGQFFTRRARKNEILKEQEALEMENNLELLSSYCFRQLLGCMNSNSSSNEGKIYISSNPIKSQYDPVVWKAAEKHLSLSYKSSHSASSFGKPSEELAKSLSKYGMRISGADRDKGGVSLNIVSL